MSSKINFGSDVLLVTGPPRIPDRADDVATYLDAPGHAAEEIDCLRFDRHQLGDRLSPLGDDDRPPLLCHLVHQPQTVGLELRCSNVLMVGHYLVSMGHH